MKFNRALVLFLLLASQSVLIAQNIKGKTLDELAFKYAKESIENFKELLSLPNDANQPEDIEANIKWTEKAFQELSFTTQRLETNSLPLLLAERKVKNAKKTVLIYLQIDGQPIDSTKWNQESAWKPVLKERNKEGQWQTIDWSQLDRGFNPDWRIFARSTSDAKGPAVAFLAALKATKSIKAQPNYNMKVIMDFEEELGSPPLPAAVKKYSEELASDMFIIFDGPRHITNQPTLSFGARGIATITLKVFGPRLPQHSGHYGNYAPNPALKMSRLLASMKDEQGRVLIPGFYDGVNLDEETKRLLALVPDDETFIRKNLGIANIDQVGNNYQESIQYPSLNIRGLNAGWVGKKVRTIIPATATAEIDVRLVIESNPEGLIGLIREHIKKQGFYMVENEPTEEERMQYTKIIAFTHKIAYRAFRTDFDSEVGLWLDRALTRAFNKRPIKKRTSGGSIPISPFVSSLGVPAVTVPTVNSDNNQHSPNENIRLGNYVDAVKTFIAILTEKL